MKLIKGFVVVVSIASLLCMTLPSTVLAGKHSLFAKAEAGITGNEPEMLAPSEIEIPLASGAGASHVESSGGGSKKWLYYGLGGALLIGGAAVGLGGSSSGGSDPAPPAPPAPPTNSTGDINVSW